MVSPSHHRKDMAAPRARASGTSLIRSGCLEELSERVALDTKGPVMLQFLKYSQLELVRRIASKTIDGGSSKTAQPKKIGLKQPLLPCTGFRSSLKRLRFRKWSFQFDAGQSCRPSHGQRFVRCRSRFGKCSSVLSLRDFIEPFQSSGDVQFVQTCTSAASDRRRALTLQANRFSALCG